MIKDSKTVVDIISKLYLFVVKNVIHHYYNLKNKFYFFTNTLNI